MRPHRAVRTLSTLAAFLSSIALLHAQTPPVAAAPANTASFAVEPYYFKTFSGVISMHADGTGTNVQTFSVVVQSEAALHDFSIVSLVYAAQSQHADFIYARVTHADGSVQETPLSNALEQPVAVTTEAPEYSDLRSKQLPIRSLRVGDTLDWQVRIVTDHPAVPNQFWGQDTFLHNVVVLDETYELHIPAGLHLTVWTNPRSGVTPAESEANGEHLYRWHRTDLTPTVGTAAEAAKKAEQTRPRTSDEEIDDTKGSLPGFAWSTFPDYTAVGAWYRSLTADRITPDAAIKAKVAELTAGKTTDLEKAQAVYNYVSSQIHYIGVDFGIGYYQPHTAAEVFANQYGDCKDKHTLLASMLSVLNIHADPVLIGAGIRFNPAVASPASFNHLITHLTLGGKDVWLDATSEIAPWESLLNLLRDKEALVIPASDAPAVRQTPKDLPYPQISTMSVVGSLDKDLTSDSTVTITMRDDGELYMRAALRSISPSSYGDAVQRVMGAMGFGGTTSEAVIGNLDDPSKPLQFTFHYHRVKEKDWGGDRITSTFQSIPAPGFAPDYPPTEAIQLGAPRTVTSTVKMQLPKGWSAELPGTVHAHTAFATCDTTYSLSNGTLTEERRYTVLEKEVPLKDSKQYLSWYDDAGADGVPFIQLHPAPIADTALAKPAPDAPSVATGAARPSDPKAADLVREAQRSLQKNDLDTGRKDLDEAAKINPTELGLWAGYATAAELLGKHTEYVADLQHEVTYHPDEVRFYPTLSQRQLQLGDTPGALDTLRAWQKAVPDDSTPSVRLVSALTDAKQYPEAVREGRAALDRLQPSHSDLIELRIAVALAQAKNGQTKEAAAAVGPLLKTITDPSLLSGINAILADTSTDLDKVRAAQQSIIDAEEKQTIDWSLTTPLSLDNMRQESSLAAAWDTMGWILFKDGKLDDAFAYCLASASLAGTAGTHVHLVAIAAAMDKPSADAIVRKPIQAFQTVHLAPSNGRLGVAAVKLVLAGGKIVNIEVQPSSPSSSTRQLKDADALLANTDVHDHFPPVSSARLVRLGFVTCNNESCDLSLIPVSVLASPVPERPTFPPTVQHLPPPPK